MVTIVTTMVTLRLVPRPHEELRIHMSAIIEHNTGARLPLGETREIREWRRADALAAKEQVRHEVAQREEHS
jgi:hypothetical protein